MHTLRNTINGITTPIYDSPSGSTFPLDANYVKCIATYKSRNATESTFNVMIKASKRKISSTLGSQILQNLTNEQKLSKLAVTNNITNIPQPIISVTEKHD